MFNFETEYFDKYKDLSELLNAMAYFVSEHAAAIITQVSVFNMVDTWSGTITYYYKD